MEVKHQRTASPPAQEQRCRGIQREVRVYDLNVARGTSCCQPKVEQAAGERDLRPIDDVDRCRRVLGGSDHDSAGLRKLLEQGAVVAVEAPQRGWKPAHTEHQDRWAARSRASRSRQRSAVSVCSCVVLESDGVANAPRASAAPCRARRRGRHSGVVCRSGYVVLSRYRGQCLCSGGANDRCKESNGRPQARLPSPDFFIVGHQKCGTTALYLMLRSHPQIFMSAVKEPRFFATDQRSRRCASRDAGRLRGVHVRSRRYLSLFAAAGDERRVGEASGQYLRSRTAASGIAALQPAARIIAILREPASFLRSFHLQMVSSRVETETDFQTAIARERDRRAGRRIPRSCHNREALLYSDHVRYVEQLRRFYAAFPRSRCWC